MKSNLSPTSLIAYKGDVLVLPCYSEPMHVGKYSKYIQHVLGEAGTQLIQELSAVGDLEPYHALLTQGYDLPVRHLIFYACLDDNPESRLSSLEWHEIWKNVVILSRLYKFKKMGIKLPVLMPSKRNLLYRIGSAFQQKSLDGEVLTILDSILKSNKKEEKVEVSLFL
jgi:hypothetical protein